MLSSETGTESSFNKECHSHSRQTDGWQVDPLPFYLTEGDEPQRSFAAAIPGDSLSLDVAGLLSILSFQYLPYDRTPDRRVRRVYPWREGGRFVDAATHAREFPPLLARLSTRSRLARQLTDILLRDLAVNLRESPRVSILLSGGLDSRIIYAALSRLSSEGVITPSLRAITWGRPGCADLRVAEKITRQDQIDWVALPLSDENLLENIRETAHTLGPLISPVHLHAMPRLATLDFLPGELLLVGTLGNGLLEGEYLWRHLTYVRSPTPQDWLGLLKGSVRERAERELVAYLGLHRAKLNSAYSLADAYERELLVSLTQNLFLYAYDYLRHKGVSVYQAFSSRAFLAAARAAIPFLRSDHLRRACLKLLRPDLVSLPVVHLHKENSDSRQVGIGDARFHDYGGWTRVHLDEIISTVAGSSITVLGVVDERGLKEAARKLREGTSAAHEISYLLVYLASLARFLETKELCIHEERLASAGDPLAASYSAAIPSSPPWGFASRPFDGRTGHLRTRLRQPLRAVGL